MSHFRRLANFSGAGYDKGRPKVVQALWVLSSALVVERIWCPPTLRVEVLRIFGATIGQRVLIRHGVRVHWPWKLVVGDDVWIGVDAWLLNLEPIEIGSNVCISQGAFICTGSHDAKSPSFEFDNAPICIRDGVWIAAQATILRGVTVGEGALVGATALVVNDIPAGGRALAPLAEITGEMRP
ncbi:putative colanic acid biosynthesis acetyltransferase [Arthrobacter sp. FW306-04-A]|uniref:putative colanic acid biosynthesis acetyltransferase n=1 Tax=Arthrobacter sp. FW306-04-A TaxID=2879619 RepID=UPI0037C0AE9A|nr:putative colanic acid biosynthesis acetyltransferase [Arthrobacter sp. FW306-04-A]